MSGVTLRWSKGVSTGLVRHTVSKRKERAIGCSTQAENAEVTSNYTITNAPCRLTIFAICGRFNFPHSSEKQFLLKRSCSRKKTAGRVERSPYHSEGLGSPKHRRVTDRCLMDLRKQESLGKDFEPSLNEANEIFVQ